MYERNLWIAAYTAKVQQTFTTNNFYWSTSECARFADDAVKEFRKRVS